MKRDTWGHEELDPPYGNVVESHRKAEGIEKPMIRGNWGYEEPDPPYGNVWKSKTRIEHHRNL